MNDDALRADLARVTAERDVALAALCDFHHEACAALAWRRRTPGGQQVREPRWSRAPISMLLHIQRAAERAGVTP